MIRRYFTRGREYFVLRNYKYETIFHIAARYNSLASLKQILGRTVFIEELLKKDYKGDTPIHTAAKSGSLEVLEFMVTACSKGFLEIQNDFGFTARDAVKEKIRIMEEKQYGKKEGDGKIVAPEGLEVNGDGTGENEDAEGNDEEMNSGETDTKLAKLKDALKYLEKFDKYIAEESWKERFDVPYNAYLN
jgi:hypothetical protein